MRTSGAYWNKTKPDYWLSDKALTIDYKPHADTEAIFLNTRTVGYYRVNYSYQGWYNLGLVLSANHEVVDPYNRDVRCYQPGRDKSHGTRTERTCSSVCSDLLGNNDILKFPN